MSYGSLRRDIEVEFGDFFEKQGFEEVEYFYSHESFGNEVWHLRDQSGTNVRVVRDRSQISVELKSVQEGYVDSLFYLRALGYSKEKYRIDAADRPLISGISKALVSDIIVEWPRMIELARSETKLEF